MTDAAGMNGEGARDAEPVDAGAAGNAGGSGTGGTAGQGGRTGSGGRSGDGGESAGGTASSGVQTGAGGTSAGGRTIDTAGTGGGNTGTRDSTGSAGATGTGGTGGTISTGGATSGIGGTSAACTGCQALEQCWKDKLCVAKLVPVAAGFSIDATEVTRSQYAAWLDTRPDGKDQSPVCAWNISFVPDSTCTSSSSVCQGGACGRHPQPCTDWCDAFAYCRAVGKRLCGAIAGGPAPSKYDASTSQWLNACTSGGVNQWSYGNKFHGGACHDYTDFVSDYTTTVPVASMSECQSPDPGYAGVFDLLGNLFEWEDNCTGTAGADDTCLAWGGSFGMSEVMPECSLAFSFKRSLGRNNTGFRCCSP